MKTFEAFKTDNEKRMASLTSENVSLKDKLQKLEGTVMTFGQTQTSFYTSPGTGIMSQNEPKPEAIIDPVQAQPWGTAVYFDGTTVPVQSQPRAVYYDGTAKPNAQTTPDVRHKQSPQPQTQPQSFWRDSNEKPIMTQTLGNWRSTTPDSTPHPAQIPTSNPSNLPPRNIRSNYGPPTQLHHSPNTTTPPPPPPRPPSPAGWSATVGPKTPYDKIASFTQLRTP
jgi:hypothetical protein